MAAERWSARRCPRVAAGRLIAKHDVQLDLEELQAILTVDVVARSDLLAVRRIGRNAPDVPGGIGFLDEDDLADDPRLLGVGGGAEREAPTSGKARQSPRKANRLVEVMAETPFRWPVRRAAAPHDEGLQHMRSILRGNAELKGRHHDGDDGERQDTLVDSSCMAPHVTRMS